MKKVLKRSLSILLAITIIFGSMYAGLSEVDFGVLFAVKAKAASESFLTFELNDDGESYSVTACDTSASGNLAIPSTYSSKPVTSIGDSAFNGCASLTTITIPYSVTSVHGRTFGNCTSLTSIIVSEYNSFYCSVDGVLFDKEQTTLIKYPNDKPDESYVIKKGVKNIGIKAFGGCVNLKSISIPSTIEYIAYSVWVGCDNLVDIHITDIASWCAINFDYKLFTFSSNPLVYAENLYLNGKLVTNLIIPRTVTTINDRAFMYYEKLSSVVIHSNVTSIGGSVFNGCDNLTIYGFPGSYAQTYAEKKEIPFKHVSDFGLVNIYGNSGTGVNFSIYNKNTILEGDALGIASGDVNLSVQDAILINNGNEYICSDGDNNNETFIEYDDLAGKVKITKDGFYDYIVPDAVVSNFVSTKSGPLNVYMTEDRYDSKPYISTVFGRQHEDDCENIYKELQSNSLDILVGKNYDVIITADLKGESSATYYLSQDMNHRISSKTGIFSQADLYDVFDENKSVYAYAVTSSGRVTEPVTIKLSKKGSLNALDKLLSSETINLLGSDTSKLTIGDDIPILGGAELSMSFLELPIGIEVEGERVRISIGSDFFKYSKSTTTSTNTKTKTQKEKEWISFKECCKEIEKEMKTGKAVEDKLKAFEKAQKQRGFGYDNLKKNTKKQQGISFDASYLGYIEGYITNGNIVFTEFSGSVAADFIAKYTLNTSICLVPVYLYVQGGANAALSLDLARTIPDENIPIEFDASLTVSPKLKLGGGVGTKGVASAGIYGSAQLPTVYEFIDKHLTMALSGTIGVEGEFAIWSGSLDLLSGTVNIFDTYFGSSATSLSSFSEAVYSEMSELMYSNNSSTPTVQYTLASRDYAESTSSWLGFIDGTLSGMQIPLYSSGSASSATVTELQTSVYKNSQTQLVQFGDKIMLAYIEDCAERDTYNRYRLMYTIYNPSTNVWTEPKSICDSGKMDVAPSLATDGESVYIAWQTINTTVTDSSEEAMYDAMNNMEIYSAKYDEDSDTFVNVIQHTSNSTYDYSPYVTVENGSATVYWVNAESTNFAAGEMSIHSSADSSNTLVYDDMNYITSLQSSGNSVSYSMDVDGDLSTNDIKLFTDGVQVGEDVVEDTIITNFAYGDFNGTETLFYSDCGTVYYVADGESIEAFSDNDGVASTLRITNFNGKPAVIYTQLTDTGSELRVSTFENDVWSEPVYLTDIGCSLSNVDVVSVDGKIYAVFDRTQTTEATDEETGEAYLEYGQTDLCMLTSEGYYDLEISNIGYDEGDISVGISAPFIVVMENKGTETINSVEFVVSDSLGYSQTITKDVNLAPGAIESVELEYTAQEGYAACDLTVTATIVDCEDIDTTNNTTTEQIGRTDIAVGAISVERISDVYKITCEVANDSLVDAENVCVDISFDIYNKTVEIGTIAAKSSYMVELLVAREELVFDENDICTLTFSASTDSEESVLGNNENTVTVENTEKLAEHEHNFVDNICDGCGMNAFTYDFTDDGIIITGYTGTDTEVSIPESINDVNVTEIAALAYYGNENITSVVIPDSVTTIGEGAFANCTNLTTITVGENNLNYSSVDGVLFNKDKTELIQYPAGKENTGYVISDSVIIIGEYALHSCDDLKYIFYSGSENEWADITVGDNNELLTNTIIHYNATDHSYEYKVDIEPTCVQEGSKHQECTVCGYCLESEIISTVDHTYSTEWTIDVAPTCTEEGSKSHHCTACGDKADITIVAATGHIYSTEWTIDVEPTCTEEGSKSYHCTGTGCEEKADITVIEATGHNYVITDVATSHPHVITYQCSVCGEEKTEDSVSSTCIVCDFTITEIDSTEYKLVSYIGTETEVVIPAEHEGVAVTTIANACFKGNTSIASVEIEEGVTTIGSLAFMNCTSLQKVTIPASVTSIGAQAFYGFTGTIYCTSGSYAHEYAVANNIKYVLETTDEPEEPIQETVNTQIDYENFIIRTSAYACKDINEILGLSESAVAVAEASYVYGNLELYGTGTVITVFDGNEYIGDFTLVVEGDVNGDSVCDVLDAMHVALVSNGHRTLDGAYAMAADSNSDDMIDVTDYQAVVNKAVS